MTNMRFTVNFSLLFLSSSFFVSVIFCFKLRNDDDDDDDVGNAVTIKTSTVKMQNNSGCHNTNINRINYQFNGCCEAIICHGETTKMSVECCYFTFSFWFVCILFFLFSARCHSFCAGFILFFSFIDIFFFISSFSSKKKNHLNIPMVSQAGKKMCIHSTLFIIYCRVFIYFFKGKNWEEIVWDTLQY